MAKGWIRYIEPQISSLKEVVTFNRLYQTMWARQGTEPDGLIATWMNLALSFFGLQKNLPEQLDGFDKTSAFVKGLKARSGLLGDPKDPAAQGIQIIGYSEVVLIILISA